MAGVRMGPGCQGYVALTKPEGFDPGGVDAPKSYDHRAEATPRRIRMAGWRRLSRSCSLSETRPPSAGAVAEAVDVFRECGVRDA